MQAHESLCNADRRTVSRSKADTAGTKGQRLLAAKGKGSHAEKGPISTGTSNRTYQRPLCVGFSEIDKYATQIYQSHFPEHHNYGDITKINEKELPDFDLLVGGFPCQSFSIAGKRRGFDDTRGTLFFDIARILKAKKPKQCLLENVKGLLSHDGGNTFKIIIATLDELGYDVGWQVLNSKNFGVPQNRERVFIVGHLRTTARPEVFPIRKNDCLSTDRQGKISPTITSRYYKQGQSDPYIVTEKTADTDSRLRVRKLTPLECERLQGFPDGWTETGIDSKNSRVNISDTQRYKCLGNAVTVPVVSAIAKKLLQKK